jgi:hypothetical protein
MHTGLAAAGPGAMLVTKELQAGPAGGREMLCRLNYQALLHLYGERLTLFQLKGKGPGGPRRALGAVAGHIDGLDARVIQDAVARIRARGISKVFVDGSNLGAMVASIKEELPQVEVTTFFHNVEARFFWGSLKLRRSPHALAVLLANYLAERRAVRYSDKRICLSERDSKLLHRVYGQAATHVTPMAMQDQVPPGFAEDTAILPEQFALFVGGTFYANRAGMAWYVRHVAPRAPIRVVVVGKGFETLRDALEIPGKVQVVGTVDNLADWYRRAQFVIAPIFDGSGMKTKLAEALMYGKKVVGTPEAFSGYEGVAKDAGWICRTADEFVDAMQKATQAIQTRFVPELREIYLRTYSFPAATERLRDIMEA